MLTINPKSPNSTFPGAGLSSEPTGWQKIAGIVASTVAYPFKQIGDSFQRNFWNVETRRYTPECPCGGAGYDRHHTRAGFFLLDKVFPVIGYAMIAVVVVPLALPILIVAGTLEGVGLCNDPGYGD